MEILSYKKGYLVCDMLFPSLKLGAKSPPMHALLPPHDLSPFGAVAVLGFFVWGANGAGIFCLGGLMGIKRRRRETAIADPGQKRGGGDNLCPNFLITFYMGQ